MFSVPVDHHFERLALRLSDLFDLSRLVAMPIDEFAVQFFDDEHSSDEDRFLLLGLSSGTRLLIVCHCERDDGEVIRIISARKATQRESAFYQGS